MADAQSTRLRCPQCGGGKYRSSSDLCSRCRYAPRLPKYERCVQCDKPLPRQPHQGRPRKYCSETCRVRGYYKPSPRQPRQVSQCVQCGGLFRWKTPRSPRKCCSDECVRQRARECAERLNASRRGQSKPRTCIVCGASFRYKWGGSGRRGCCSRTCGWKYQQQQKAIGRPERLAQRASQLAQRALQRDAERTIRCIVCGAEFIWKARNQKLCGAAQCRRRYVNARYIKKPRTPPTLRVCRACGTEIYSRSARRKWCSKCQPRGVHCHRAKKYGVPYDRSIKTVLVFARDKWRCQQCGRRTPPHLRSTRNFRAPELDHIVPLSVTGSPGHVWTNVQCLCRQCNTEKGVRVQGQLRLV